MSEEEEGRELLDEGGLTELSGKVERVEGREVRSYRGAAIIGAFEGALALDGFKENS